MTCCAILFQMTSYFQSFGEVYFLVVLSLCWALEHPYSVFEAMHLSTGQKLSQKYEKTKVFGIKCKKMLFAVIGVVKKNVGIPRIF